MHDGTRPVSSSKDCTDAGYCGLSTKLARHVEEELRSDNDVFAQGVWGKSWADVFAADVTEQFVPNDFEIRRPDWFTARRLRQAISKMTDFAPDISGSCAGSQSAPERRGATRWLGFNRAG
jgi:hypothetical protein